MDMKYFLEDIFSTKISKPIVPPAEMIPKAKDLTTVGNNSDR